MNEEPESVKKPFPLKKIISGGQEGADQGGLLAAQELGLQTGRTLALVCHCAPAVCHGDVLKAVLEERMK